MSKKNNNKRVEQITSMDEDFAQWYTDIVKKAELVDYSSVKGCVILRPYAYAIWENIQKYLDGKFKEKGHENVYMPLLIPESLLQKEKDHVEGFAPEVAWVTKGGNDELTEKLCVRPTSETLFCEHYAKIVQSYKDLPKLYNQWCSVVRWEKTTRPFLRTTEFLWQEGHTIHATKEEAEAETIQMLNIYADFCENMLAIPVVKGRKTEKEKFAGAEATYTIESLMHDGKALQSGTSHFFGQNFAKAFGIQFADKNEKLEYVNQTSWGMTTRIIGAIIMVHGDDEGLKMPPRIAPTQVVIVPIAQHKEGVIEKATELKDRIAKVARVKMDISDKTPGWKFSEYEMKGIPVRLEVGPKDMEKNQVVLVRRDTREKIFVPMDELETKIPELLEDIHKSMLEAATKAREEKTNIATTMEEFNDIVENKTGFVKAMWCGDKDCEDKIKEDTGATSRCIPFEQEELSDTCVCCGKKAKHMVYWGRAY
ncbi:proline--tRNA ligase [Clostridium pasteurianum DSM 525 = ATCC 6013]|uniref:Proline--tRNA ligase n=1 Tax=Clostridium pasteurianum DSM 525 = ATCC 6013 TaxID=1262449 RepID=A0A0H3J6E1_CLOPA|nr:proline--tRNA ligase [Clostridium pasteurianum]AJA47478.1 proline--tRNA ligase [Clostridium pasteurianum DSM 525 = ATCC 6013]AJA51466.1 proline--tRNA ligase [Clostridium pasteurianum DSM 525 = ATCC 6013]AOZ74799.1 proline--tRNA ligase [Clostridium pasteurianum DSM 525 = ATCC 6013]AOZ78595.1 proline--tRNA ligase [Clostridium pasteurianum]ELP57685.1 prolyl-tRNA ligase [Clostridium pasteurianum DSM 525 = ATCC 6013]